MIRSNHNKTAKRPNKIIPRRQHHFCLDVTVRKPNSPYRHAEKVVDAIVAALIFIRDAMEKLNPPYLLVVTRKEEENNSPRPGKLAWRDRNPNMTRSTRKTIREMDPHSLRSLAICQRGASGDGGGGLRRRRRPRLRPRGLPSLDASPSHPACVTC